MVFKGSKLVVWRLFVFCEKKLYKARLFVKFCQGFFYTRICPSLIMAFFYAFKTIFFKMFCKEKSGKVDVFMLPFLKMKCKLVKWCSEPFFPQNQKLLKEIQEFCNSLRVAFKIVG